MIVGLLHLKKYRNSLVKYFIYFIVYVWLMSNIGSYPFYFYKYPVFQSLQEMVQGTKFSNNYWWFNIFWNILTVAFLGWYFMKSLKNKTNILLLKWVLGLFFVSSLVYLGMDFERLFNGSSSFLKINGAVVILFCVALYLTEMLESNSILNFYRDMNFYIAIGILIFWLVVTPLVFFESYYKDYDMDYVRLRMYIYLFINLFMYGMFSIGFIVSNTSRNVDNNQ